MSSDRDPNSADITDEQTRIGGDASTDVSAIILEKLARLCNREPRLEDHLALLGLDSVTTAELTFDIEKQFDIRLDDRLLDAETVGELVDLVLDTIADR